MDRTDPCGTRDTWTGEGQVLGAPGWVPVFPRSSPVGAGRGPRSEWPSWVMTAYPGSALLQAAQQESAAEADGPSAPGSASLPSRGRGLARTPGRDCGRRLPRIGGLTRLRCERCR
jgi:hypothetical protein